MNDFATTRPNWARMSMNDALNNFNEELGAIIRAHNLNRPGHRGITDAVVRENTIQAMVDAVTTVAEVIEPLQWQLAPKERFRSEPTVFVHAPVDRATERYLAEVSVLDTPDEADPDGEIFMQTLWEMRHGDDEPYPGVAPEEVTVVSVTVVSDEDEGTTYLTTGPGAPISEAEANYFRDQVSEQDPHE